MRLLAVISTEHILSSSKIAPNDSHAAVPATQSFRTPGLLRAVALIPALRFLTSRKPRPNHSRPATPAALTFRTPAQMRLFAQLPALRPNHSRPATPATPTFHAPALTRPLAQLPALRPNHSRLATPATPTFRAPTLTRLLAVLPLLLILAGCKVGPNYSRPATPTIPAFRAPAPLPDGAGPSIANTKWFDLFQDTELRKLVEEALKNNYDLRLAAARVDAARGNVGVNRANQFPNFNGTSDLNAVRFSRAGAFPLPDTVAQERNFGGAGLSLLSFELDLWGRLRRATEAARADLLSAEESRKAVVVTLVSDVAAAYFALRELDLELEIARRTVATRQESLRLIDTRQKGGVATLLDVRQAEQLVYSATQSIPDLQRAIEQTENRLSLLLGRSPGPIPRGATLVEQKQPLSLPIGLPAELLERRPDIRAAEQDLVSANAQIGVAKAAYFPRIALTGSSGYQSNQLTELFTGSTGIWSFVPQLSQPIFQAGRLGANVNITKANREAALVRYERAIQTSFREVSDSLVQYQRVKEILAEQNLLVGTLKDRSRLAYLRYRGGVDTLLNALDSDRDLFTAELNQARTQRDELLALVQLYKALGGGWN